MSIVKKFLCLVNNLITILLLIKLYSHTGFSTHEFSALEIIFYSLTRKQIVFCSMKY